MPSTKKTKAAAKLPEQKAAGLKLRPEWFSLKETLIALVCGTLLGFSSPGFDQWYLAWFALAPFFLLLYRSSGLPRQIWIGLTFGLAYNLTYLHWYLNLYPLDWLGFPGLQGIALAALAWIIVAGHQTLIFACYAALIGKLPLSGSFSIKKTGKKVSWPAILTLPLLWVLVFNKIGNCPDLLGVPWPMLEYTQYQQTHFIQSASVIGGVGISYLIVATNVTLASLAATFAAKMPKGSPFKPIAAENRETAFYHCLGMGLILGAFYCLGMWQESQIVMLNKADIPISALQAGINIEMQKADHHYTLEDMVLVYEKLMANRKDELVVLSEGALPAYLREQPGLQNWLKSRAARQHIDILAGSMDREALRPYNSAYGVTSSGELLNTVYHKRFLVPIGEYTPLMVQYMPEWIKRWTNTPAGNPFAAGKDPGVLALSRGKVAPLICFESISPEVACASCRAGGELLINISDLAWFHQSDCGKQMIAFGVLRAIENRRYLIFAANSGPSAIIDQKGAILQITSQGENQVLSGMVGLNSQITPFALWYR